MAEKTTSVIMTGVESRYFLQINGHPQLRRMAVSTARLYLLCFASHRFRQINDNLIEAFIHLGDRYEQEAKLAAEAAALKAMTEASTNLKAGGQVLNLFLGGRPNPASSFGRSDGILRYSLSLRDVEELLEKRGPNLHHTTVWRWVQRYGPELEQRLRRHLKPTNKSSRMDETYGTPSQRILHGGALLEHAWNAVLDDFAIRYKGVVGAPLKW